MDGRIQYLYSGYLCNFDMFCLDWHWTEWTNKHWSDVLEVWPVHVLFFPPILLTFILEPSEFYSSTGEPKPPQVQQRLSSFSSSSCSFLESQWRKCAAVFTVALQFDFVNGTICQVADRGIMWCWSFARFSYTAIWSIHCLFFIIKYEKNVTAMSHWLNVGLLSRFLTAWLLWLGNVQLTRWSRNWHQTQMSVVASDITRYPISTWPPYLFIYLFVLKNGCLHVEVAFGGSAANLDWNPLALLLVEPLRVCKNTQKSVLPDQTNLSPEERYPVNCKTCLVPFMRGSTDS